MFAAPWRSQVAFDAMVQVGVWGEGVRPPERTAMVRSWAELNPFGVPLLGGGGVQGSTRKVHLGRY